MIVDVINGVTIVVAVAVVVVVVAVVVCCCCCCCCCCCLLVLLLLWCLQMQEQHCGSVQCGISKNYPPNCWICTVTLSSFKMCETALIPEQFGLKTERVLCCIQNSSLRMLFLHRTLAEGLIGWTWKQSVHQFRLFSMKSKRKDLFVQQIVQTALRPVWIMTDNIYYNELNFFWIFCNNEEIFFRDNNYFRQWASVQIRRLVCARILNSSFDSAL